MRFLYETKCSLVRFLNRVGDLNQSVKGAGDRTFDQDRVVLGEDANDFEVLDGGAVVTELSRHFEATEGTTRGRRGTDRTAAAVSFVHTVRCFHTGEVVTLHYTGEAATFCETSNVDDVTSAEGFNGKLLAFFVFFEFFCVTDAHFAYDTLRSDTGLFKDADVCAVEAAVTYLAVFLLANCGVRREEDRKSVV